MQVRVCPKCAKENKATNASCSKCYSSLETVVPTESKRPEPAQAAPQAARPAAPPAARPAGPAPAQRTAGPQPLNGPPQVMGQQTQYSAPPQPGGYAPPQVAQPNGPVGGPAGGPAGGPQPVGYKYAPAVEDKKSYGWVVLVVLAVLLGGAIFFVTKKAAPPPPPKIPADKVIAQFIQAKATLDPAKCRPFLSEESIYTLDHAFSTKQDRSAGFDEKEVTRMYVFDVGPRWTEIRHSDVTYKIVKDPEAEPNTAIVCVTTTPKNPNLMGGDYEYVLVNEKSNWKVDFKLTTARDPGMGRSLIGGPNL